MKCLYCNSPITYQIRNYNENDNSYRYIYYCSTCDKLLYLDVEKTKYIKNFDKYLTAEEKT